MATLEEYISRLRREVQERAEKQNAESTETDIPVEAELIEPEEGVVNNDE